ncbi:aldo/keto reductase [Thermoanaerobacterium sp. DL9XJH110]|uniref:aldo/keto reductase n=1 Tax=Thermoanaerobacterium sp. DL9XJH110 TaxID=3386643 RepID=UPI003BB4B4DE
MRYRKLGSTGLLGSEIGFGAVAIGRDWAFGIAEDPRRPEEKEAIYLVEHLSDVGINFIDTAPAYQESEKIIGKALKGKRDKFYIATKVGERFDGATSFYDYSEKATLSFIESRLKALRTDYVDVVQIHSCPLEVLERAETVNALLKAKKAVKARFIGVRGSVEVMLEALKYPEIDVLQFSYNILDRACEELLLLAVNKAGRGVIIKDCLKKDLLSYKYKNSTVSDRNLLNKISRLDEFAKKRGMALDELAIRYVLLRDEISTVILGSKNYEHVKKNTSYSDGQHLDLGGFEV